MNGPDLEALLALNRDGDGFVVTVPDGWQQGRGAFGGLALAMVTRAMEAFVNDRTRPLRSMSAQLVAPALPGAARVEVSLVRASNSVTTVRATLTQSGEAVLCAVGVFAAARRDAPSWQRGAAMPETPWRAVEPVPFVEGAMPVFVRHFEFRMVEGAPFAAAPLAETSVWVRPVFASRRDAAWVVMQCDVVWPAMLVTFEGPRPTATITYTIDLHAVGDALDAEAPLLHRGVSRWCTDGYASETRELYNVDGHLAAVNHQVFVVIR